MGFDLNKANLDPKYVEIMAMVDSVAKGLKDDENRIRMYEDLRDTFINRLEAIKPKKKWWHFS